MEWNGKNLLQWISYRTDNIESYYEGMTKEKIPISTEIGTKLLSRQWIKILWLAYLFMIIIQ